MKVTFYILLLFLSVNGLAQSGQDSLLLLNGKSYKGKIEGITNINGESVLKMSTNLGKKNNNRYDYFGTYRIYSYTKDGKDTVLYQPNESLGDFLSVKETKDVTIGSYDARKTFKPHVPFWTGVGIGFASSLWDTYLTKKSAYDTTLITQKEPGFFKSKPSVFPFFVPVVLSVSWSFPTFKLRQKKMIHTEYINNENYYRGYHRIAKQKRMLGALVGGVSGIISGMIVYYAVQ
ncbi:hypothetical protein K6119_11745 [Paracrocinitomix mangrovi]|uniref:hypothetical protein n=1 Tax=Paracrocinitomix mangrovi TaxID=2862509 RepID=UPI001C8EEFE7|nr:hypothetical protein [Paracrocinitomix mangrovi]UKN00407.1 hypothetical protein K6119_11745 [Paracrocinitomix mangrovi]